jgi:hypothetical protein
MSVLHNPDDWLSLALSLEPSDITPKDNTYLDEATSSRASFLILHLPHELILTVAEQLSKERTEESQAALFAFSRSCKTINSLIGTTLYTHLHISKPGQLARLFKDDMRVDWSHQDWHRYRDRLSRVTTLDVETPLHRHREEIEVIPGDDGDDDDDGLWTIHDLIFNMKRPSGRSHMPRLREINFLVDLCASEISLEAEEGHEIDPVEYWWAGDSSHEGLLRIGLELTWGSQPGHTLRISGPDWPISSVLTYVAKPKPSVEPSEGGSSKIPTNTEESNSTVRCDHHLYLDYKDKSVFHEKDSMFLTFFLPNSMDRLRLPVEDFEPFTPACIVYNFTIHDFRPGDSAATVKDKMRTQGWGTDSSSGEITFILAKAKQEENMADAPAAEG